jgi:hypothetical protein
VLDAGVNIGQFANNKTDFILLFDQILVYFENLKFSEFKNGLIFKI